MARPIAPTARLHYDFSILRLPAHLEVAMRWTSALILAPLTALALAACQPTAKAPEPAPIEAPAQAEINPADLPMPAAGDYTGVLSIVQDAGYPMFWTMITPAAGEVVAALVNNEELETPNGISALQGKTVKATVEVRSESDLLQLSASGKVITEIEREVDTPFVAPEGSKTIAGKLSGADGPSGDLPTDLTITPKTGAAVTVRHFIDEAVTKLNGKEVSVIYLESQSAYLVKIAEAK